MKEYSKNILLLICIPCFLSFGKVRLTKFETSPYKGEAKKGITFQKRENDVLKINYATESNCCFTFKGEINYTNDTLYLTTISSGNACRSLCWYEHSYTIKGITNDNYTVKFQQKRKK